MTKLIIDIEKKTFVYKGYFYGYVTKDELFVQDEKGIINCNLKDLFFVNIDILSGETILSKTILVLNLKDKRHCISGGISRFYNDACVPNLIFESRYLVHKFHKFIKLCQDT